MSQDKNTQSRRERMMNSSKELPGDQARADAEVNEDFDSADSGSFDTHTEGSQEGNADRRQQINENGSQLEGDADRAADDERVDGGGKSGAAKEPSKSPAHDL